MDAKIISLRMERQCFINKADEDEYIKLYRDTQMCPNSAYVDADWCRAINPFQFTEATKKTVTDNIFCLFRNYLLCTDIETVIFPYGFHGERKSIYSTKSTRFIM